MIRYRRQADFKELQLQQCNNRIEIQNDQIAKLEEDLFFSIKGTESNKTTTPFTPLKTHQELIPDISEKLVKLTKNQDVQTDMMEIDETDNSNRLENLKKELLNTKNDLVAKEEALQQLKTKLNESEMNVSLFRTQIGDKQAQISFYEKHILDLQQMKKEDTVMHRPTNGAGGDAPSNEIVSEEVISLKVCIEVNNGDT